MSEEKTTKPDTSKMVYRYLGNSGLKVSVIALGNWINNEDDNQTYECTKAALENGINYLDTAEEYGFGQAETTLGKALKKLNIPREKIVVSTKLMKVGHDPNDAMLSRKHICEGIKNSLKRLGLDYVDIVFCHRYDRMTSMKEVVEAMNWVLQQGYALYWGTSEWTACQIFEAYDICDKYKLERPIVEQCQYNMLERDKMENEYRDLFRRYKMGTTIFSPLRCGILTGKYLDSTPDDSRANSKNEAIKNMMKGFDYFKNKEAFDKKIKELKNLAETKLNCTLAQLAIAWTIVNPDVSTCIIGATKASQVEENCKAVEVVKKLDKDILIEIEKILDNAPKGEIDFRTWKELPSRRNVALGIDYIRKKE
jgi:voltage-dependent potassium channel beta subunit